MTQLPSRTKDYIGPVTDTRIWDRFDLRAGDVVLSTPPKCGTTWSQAILMMLLSGEAVEGKPVWRDSLWLDCGFRDQEDAKSTLDANSGRRCIKSHTPFDGITYRPDVTYLTVYRHPIDVHFSLEKHVANMRYDILDFHFPEAPGEAFERFLNAPATDAGTDDLTLSSLLWHYRSFNAYAQLPNVHFFHYADLIRDIHAQIARYGFAIGVDPDPELVAAIARASSFSSMKQTTEDHKRPKEHAAFRNEAGFFDSATSNKWQGRLSAEQIKAYDTAFSTLAEESEIKWLETGHL